MNSKLALRAILSVIFAFAACVVDSRISVAQATKSLRQLAPPDFYVGGVMFGYDAEWPFADSQAIAEAEFNSVTATAFMPYGAWPVQEDGPDTGGWETVVDWASARGLAVHGHTLLFPKANRDLAWWNALPDAEAEGVICEFVQTIAASRAGCVDVWDVVNEVVASDGDPMDASGLRTDFKEYSAIGADYVEKAFHWAHEADPNAVLIINEAGAASLNTKSDRLLALAIDLKSRGVPIDGVGFQMHQFDPQFEPDYASIAANFKRFAAAGFQLYITELDVVTKATADPTDLPTSVEAERQSRIFNEITRLALNEPACRGLFFWDFIDERSWLHPTSFDFGDDFLAGDYTFPGLFFYQDGVLTAKESYKGVQSAFAQIRGNFRIKCDWHPKTGVLTRQGTPTSGGNYAPCPWPGMQKLGKKWTSNRWQITPVGSDTYRIVCNWEGGSGVLSRSSTFDGQYWQPTGSVYLDALHEDWQSQLWTLEPAGGKNRFRIKCAWGPFDGYLSRSSDFDGCYWKPGPWTYLDCLDESWESQIWKLQKLRN